MYEVYLICQTTDGVVSQRCDMIYTEDELRDNLAGWMGFDWVLEIHIKRV